MGLCPIDPDRNFGAGGAELLEQSAVSADPQIFLFYFHLEREIDEQMISQIKPERGFFFVRSFSVPLLRNSQHRGILIQEWCPAPAAASQ